MLLSKAPSGDLGQSHATTVAATLTRRVGQGEPSVTGDQPPRQYGVELQRPAPLRLPAHPNVILWLGSSGSWV